MPSRGGHFATSQNYISTILLYFNQSFSYYSLFFLADLHFQYTIFVGSLNIVMVYDFWQSERTGKRIVTEFFLAVQLIFSSTFFTLLNRDRDNIFVNVYL